MKKSLAIICLIAISSTVPLNAHAEGQCSKLTDAEIQVSASGSDQTVKRAIRSCNRQVVALAKLSKSRSDVHGALVAMEAQLAYMSALRIGKAYMTLRKSPICVKDMSNEDTDDCGYTQAELSLKL
ncbi:MAG: hypothetical protein EOP06_22570 [Proteobacteria bacterium]|nr:MAG: hypothetical protein EOP06_22570 [Pseudomonadota bacterium]